MTAGRRTAAGGLLLGGFLLAAALPGSAQEVRNPAPSGGKAAVVDRRPAVAVLYFDYLGSDASLVVLRKGLTQMLITDLAGSERVRVVERARLQEILDELKLSHSVHFDARTAARIGRLLGARYLVLGNYLDYRGVLRLNADLVDVETGGHTTGTSASGPLEEFLGLEQSLSESLARTIAAKTADVPTEPPGSAAGPPKVARIRPPARLPARTAAGYGKALEALDRGDRAAARTELQRTLGEQPDFALAAQELDRLLR